MGFTKVNVLDSNEVFGSSTNARPIVRSVKDMFGARYVSNSTHITDAKLHDANFAFLTTSLAKLDPKLYKPLHNVTWSEDVPSEVGGAFVDYVEWYSVDYAGIMNEAVNLTSNNTNIVPRVNAQGNQHRAKVYTYEIGYDLRWIELEKMSKLKMTESIQQIYQTGILAGWDYQIQKAAYLGIDNDGGLFNNGNVKVNTIDNAATTGKGFEGLDDGVVIAFINGVITDYLNQSNMNVGLIPDTLLVPTFVANDLASRNSPMYTANLYEFIKEHNIGKGYTDGYKLNIRMRPALDTLGAAGKGRIVAYKKSPEFVKIYIPKQVGLYKTEPNPERFAYTSLFVGQFSEVVLPYNNSSDEFGAVSYYDFTK